MSGNQNQAPRSLSHVNAPFNVDSPSNVNSPSKIPAPKSRSRAAGGSTFFGGDSALAPMPAAAVPPVYEGVGQKRRQSERSPSKPAAGGRAAAAQSSGATSTVRTYRASGTTTTRPSAAKPAASNVKRMGALTITQPPAKESLYSEALAEAEQLGRKRPAWDTRGRLEDMESLTEILKQKILDSSDGVQTLQQKLEFSEQRVRELESFKQSMSHTVAVKEQETSQIGGQLAEMKLRFETELATKDLELGRARAQLQGDLDVLTRQRDSLKAELEQATVQLQDSRLECSSLKGTISRNGATLLDLESQLGALRGRIDVLDAEGRSKDEAAGGLRARLAAAEALVAELEGKVQTGETLRRKLHNSVQELKGNIRVFCRVRPLLPAELGGPGARMEDELAHFVLGGRTPEEQEEIQMVQTAESASGRPEQKAFPFAFDKVFGPGACQDAVFDEISQLVQSALDGYRVCIFAYGQTGSGKTFTMEGGRGDDAQQAGMIPRAVQQIFSTAEALAAKGWSFGFEASYLEIYNEAIRDLLTGEEGKHEVRHAHGRTTVTELQVLAVRSPGEVMQLLAKAAHNRAVAETQCNERSSRSHSVFTLRLTGENAVTTEKVDGLLNLIDLAGSERLSQSGSTGDRLKETQAINKSLSALGDVIYALANKEAHVPFRNSKLTYLLQHSLGGNCKTLMFVNVSPARGNFQETLCSLRFATKVNSCQIGTARRSAK